MHHRNTGVWVPRAALWGALLFATFFPVFPVLAQPGRIGLVIGNSAYSAFPALPTCLASSRALANALRGLDYQVIERQDVTSGGFAAAIDEFDRGMKAAPGASVFVYVCGYVAGMNDRPFLLPVSASIQRASDVMTQGLLAKAMLDTLVRGQPSRGVLALDLVPASGVSAPVLDTLGGLATPDGVGLIAATTLLPTTEPTPLSVALAAGIAAPGVQSGALLVEINAKLQNHPATQIAALHLPSVSRRLVADEPPPPTQPASAQATPNTAGPNQALPESFPEESAMSDSDRRRVQEALARLGYYGAQIDGLFGPETRAAIRRFQHEIGVEMTGTITGEQAARLVTRN